MPKTIYDVRCIEDGLLAVLTPATEVYPHRPDLKGKWLYVCPCGARVGCHELTTRPLGTPAAPHTQKLRRKCHEALDALWRLKMAREGVSKSKARGKAYHWLSGVMGLEGKETHIGMFSAEQCRTALEALAPYSHFAREEIRAL